jgi:hypothetical protein
MEMVANGFPGLSDLFVLFPTMGGTKQRYFIQNMILSTSRFIWLVIILHRTTLKQHFNDILSLT